jgi:hypothetical protein
MKSYALDGGKFIKSDHPAFVRRFPRYAKRKVLTYSEYTDSERACDVVVINQAADLTAWKRRRIDFESKLVFDANDPYLLDSSFSLKNALRGSFKYFSGKHDYLEFNYRKTYLDFCKQVDAIAVGHFLLYDMFRKLDLNVFLIPDYSIDFDINMKTKYTLSGDGVINIFWEGLGSSFQPFSEINRIFLPFKKEYKFIFHFVTDLVFYSIGDLLNKKYIFEVAKNMAPDFFMDFRFYQWSEFALNNIAINCDFAIIPLPLDRSSNYFKPENKLIHMWRMGLPTIVSGIPSYSSVMNEADLEHYCLDDDQWRATILMFIKNEEVRRLNSTRGACIVDRNYSNLVIDGKWESLFSSLNL